MTIASGKGQGTRRGYFGIGAEGISKAMNLGSLFRTAHAFGASFVFTVGAAYERRVGHHADTSKSAAHLPFYSFPDAGSLILPDDCKLVAVELLEDAVELPSFQHPPQAAYVLGPERGSLSDDLLARCDFALKIPTSFCVNLGIAGAIVMYDRLISLGRFPPRPLRPGGPTEALPEPEHGGYFSRKAKAMAAFADRPPEPFGE